MEPRGSWFEYWCTTLVLLVIVIGMLGTMNPSEHVDLLEVVFIVVGVGVGVLLRITFVIQREAQRKKTH